MTPSHHNSPAHAGDHPRPPADAAPALPRNLLIVCLFIIAWLIALHLRLSNHENPDVTVIGQAFDMTRESTVPTCWAILQALTVALTAAAVAAVLRIQKVNLNRRIAWIGAAILFAAIAIDDGAAIHERLGAITSLDLMDNLNYPSYPWHITVAPFLALALLTVIIMIWRDLAQCRGLRSMLLLALALFGISQGIDFVEGVDRMSAFSNAPTVKILPGWMVIEEALEMAGTAFFLYVFLSYLLFAARGLHLAVEDNVVRCRTQPTPEPQLSETP